MTQKHKEASMKFIEHFGYYPNHPNDIDFDQDAYAEDRKSTRLNSSHPLSSRMPSSA